MSFAVLAEPTRRQILDLLRDGERPVGDLVDRLAISQPAVSKHLRVLRDAGLVDVHARAQQRLYTLRPESLEQLHEWLERYRRIWDERFEQFDELLVELKDQEKSHGRSKRK